MAITLDGTAGTTTPALTNSALTSGRVTYAGTSGVLQDSANITYNGTTVTLLATGVPLFIAATNGNGNQLGWSNAAAATPQFYMGSPAADTLQFANGSGIEIARINSTGNIVLKGGSAGADGVGVTFPATQVASTNGNCLDDYEEGTFTPTIDSTNAGTGRATTVTTATYTKVGRSVSVVMYLTLATLGTGGSGSLQIKGLPFTTASFTAFNVGYVTNLASSVVFVSGYADASTTAVTVSGMASASTGVGGLGFSSYAAASMAIIINGTYFV